MYLPPGVIYKITWPAGSQLLVTLGSNPNYDIMESEVRAFRPLFTVPPNVPPDEHIYVPYLRTDDDTEKQYHSSVTYNIVCMDVLLR